MDREGPPAPGAGPTRMALPGGRVLEVRPVQAGDLEALAALYDGLDPDDRYRRFFSVSRPPRRLLEGMVAVADRGGQWLVAVADPDGAGALVAEAGYALASRDTGELAITVVRGWRGWLGPYLVDRVVAAAAARGLTRLEAYVLATNRAMLALLRARHPVVDEREDWTVVHLVIDTAPRPPRVGCRPAPVGG
ncbi:MAG TPA: hypothetical protein VE152_08215 [Acidimicrobiales bacterium]|nr:hypothetical protein [Acidimicrobiales bacterium]